MAVRWSRGTGEQSGGQEVWRNALAYGVVRG